MALIQRAPTRHSLRKPSSTSRSASLPSPAPTAGEHREKRVCLIYEPELTSQDTESPRLSAQIQQALTPAIRRELYPKAAIDIFLTVIESDGPISDLSLFVVRHLASTLTRKAASLRPASRSCKRASR